MARTLLIDGDIVAYRAAAGVEKAHEWEPGEFTTTASLPDAIEVAVSQIKAWKTRFSAKTIYIALTDSDGNFRKKVLPTYKANRAGAKKPMLLKAMRQWLLDTCDAVLIPTLEGDDVLGIMATHKAYAGEKIIVSIDKDMQGIPGLAYRPGFDDQPRMITEKEADRWHLIQTLAGDSVDGYAGCPKIGKVKAARIIDAAPPGGEWDAVVAAFAKAGCSEDEALTQARVARICRAEDYDSKAKKVKLWSPTSIR